ncbi:dihydropteroate synthase [Candidatus Peregrinibacteria bacterium]|nr:dihydropteroate synthase [Candidatus Peregrinibacteria bacterium]
MLESVPKIMGVLNITPDSFSGDGVVEDFKPCLLKLIEDGADIIDVGGESTGPGSKEVSLDEEMERIRPVIDYIAKEKLANKVEFSIDTYKAPIAKYALEHGFTIVNDVTALRGDSEMLDVLLEYNPKVILMYSKDSTPRTSTESIEYDDVIASIKTFFISRIVELVDAGFDEDNIIIDPGMGMFVSAEPKYSFEIIERLPELRQLGYPICIGISRKSFLGGDIKNRDKPSVEYSLKAIENGASIVRVHNVMLLKKQMAD